MSVEEVTAAFESARVSLSGVSFAGKSLRLNTEDDVKPIIEEIDSCKDLQFLNLEGNTLGVEASQAIAKSLEKHPELKRALWKDLFTGRMKTEIPKALEFLGTGLVTAGAHLLELDLSDNAFGPIGVEGLASLLRSSSCYALEELRLNNNGLGITGAKLLAKALLDCYKYSNNNGKSLALKVFIAGRNRLENEGAKALAEVFKTIGTFEEIAMPQNGIYHDGVRALSDAFKHNTNLQILNLNDNTIGPEGAKAIAEVLPSLHKLREINFGDCLLKTKGAQHLAAGLQSCTELEQLSLGFNEIRYEGAKALISAISNKSKLKVLVLDGNELGSRGRTDVKNLLKECGKLNVLGSLDEDVSGDSDSEDSSNSSSSSDDIHVTVCTKIGPPKEAENNKIVLAEDFLAVPSGENFFKLGNDRTKLLLASAVSVRKFNFDNSPPYCVTLTVKGDLTSDVLRVATEARSRSLGPFHPTFNIQNILLEGMEKVLPDDAHLRVNGKLHISLTRVYDGKNVIVSQFDTREDLMQALLASAFIPVFSGIIPPKFHGVRYMDGGFSDNLPTLDENTITVSPFCGESDICPRDDSMQLFHINVANTSIELSKHNIYRIARILFPPKPEILSNMCKQGFDDALRFLHRNNLINCTRCLAVQSTFVVQESLEESIEYDPQCHECKIHRQEALVSNLPDTVLTIFQEAIDSANNGIINWVFKHRGMKLLSVLSLPYTLPADVMYATFTNIIGDTIEKRTFQYKVLGNGFLTTDKKCKHMLMRERRFMAAAPVLGNSLWELSKYFLDQLSALLNKVNSQRQQLSAKISCQLAITEYGGYNYDVESCQDAQLENLNKMNLNFTLNLDESDLPITQSPNRKFATNKIFSRKSSFSVSKTGEIPIGDDTFDNILQVTSHHEAIMAYYYLDENNKVKVTEIFDVTDSDSPAVQTSCEKELNQQLQFDDDWDESTWTTHADVGQYLSLEDRRASMAELSEYSLEDMLEKDSSNIFSDPECEWTGTFRVDEPEDYEHSQTADLRPESEQPDAYKSTCHKPYHIPSFTYQEYDS